MKSLRLSTLTIVFAALSILSACTKPAEEGSVVHKDTTVRYTTYAATRYQQNYPVTLPVLQAFMADSTFVSNLRSHASLSDTDVQKLKALTYRLPSEDSIEQNDIIGTDASRTLAATEIERAVGKEKGSMVIDYIRSAWSGAVDPNALYSDSTGGEWNKVPSDRRIVVNIPAYRLDLFDSGKLVTSYKITIGYPEFPLPVGERTAKTVIFNPTWVPPDEPWVESSATVKVGKEVAAGDPKNPLGIAKIPIGSPTLIHGGKRLGSLGTFNSHGCVGLTDADMAKLVVDLGRATGTDITQDDIKTFGSSRNRTREIVLKDAVPVELRYETMVVTNGKLRVYRDVYAHGTNSEAQLTRLLGQYGISSDQLTPAELSSTRDAIAKMSADSAAVRSAGVRSAASTRAPNADSAVGKAKSPKLTKTEQPTEIVVEIRALAGKGYPSADSVTKKPALAKR